ncbi:MAG: DNA translocase FtsK [Firmicutes bacterium]|nr:DNA translocase FtsK [Bacillota bacterium]
MVQNKKSNTKKRSVNRAGKTGGKQPAKRAQADPADLARNKELIGLGVLALAVVLLISYFVTPDVSRAEVGAVGTIGLWCLKAMAFLAGEGAVGLPVFLLVFGVLICIDRNRGHAASRYLGLFLLFWSVLALLNLHQPMAPFGDYVSASAGSGGGVLGAVLSFLLLRAFGRIGATVLLIALCVAGLLLALEASLVGALRGVGGAFASFGRTLSYSRPEEEAAKTAAKEESRRNDAPARRRPLIFTHDQEDPAPLISDKKKKTAPAEPPPDTAFSRDYLPDVTASADELAAAAMAAMHPQPLAPEPAAPSEPPPETPAPAEEKPAAGAASANGEGAFRPFGGAVQEPAGDTAAGSQAVVEYRLPPLDLTTKGKRKRNPQMNQMLNDSIGVLENTLESFGVKASVTQVVAGPAVTRYELQPAPGVKVARITSLSDDIALSLAAQGVRIEAPIPGKSAIGIEVARKDIDTVYFREVIESDAFQNSSAKLSFALGKNIAGECIVGDLAKMPHLLIAGATGSGKSICVNSIICSILYKAKPDEVKLLLIDPKKVEMTNYNTLPHLLAPVVSDSKKAANALKWVVNEMENRYSLFVGAAVKDFKGYNQANPEAALPQIVVIIDELADLMMVAKHDVEEAICRIAQMARAAGIHLVVATQRPSVDVITGLIKANIPSRIAFAVSSYTDSRTILDMGGAEKLMGRGDMLYHPVGSNKPMRVQGSFIDEADIKRLIQFCSQQAQPCFSQSATAAAEAIEQQPERDGEEVDDLFVKAGRVIIGTGQASTSFLQRKLAIGNPRAARLIDTLEAKGVVGGPKGAKPRDILMSMEEFEELYGSE